MTFIILPFLFLIELSVAEITNWHLGKWNGYCRMSLDEKDGSQITSFEFRKDLTGAYYLQTFKDNRCSKLKEDIKKDFSYEITRSIVNSKDTQIFLKLKYKAVKKGDISDSEFAFKKYGQGTRAQIVAHYLHSEMGENNKIKTLLDSKEGVISHMPDSLFSKTK